MKAENKIATVFGGTGFVGRHVVHHLARAGYTVKVATRVPERAYFLRVCGGVGQVVPVACNYGDHESLRGAVAGSRLVVNCIGVLHERRRGDFKRTHVEIPAAIAAACKLGGVERFVHISALGVDKSSSRYAFSKREGEKAVRAVFPAATVLRPSVIFGAEDRFINTFAELARYVPALPLIGGGRTKFQPVWVSDVADAVMAALILPSLGESDPRGKTFELGGPEVVTFREILERIFLFTGRKKKLVSLPWGLASLMAFFLGLLPAPLLTPDQVSSLRYDSVVGPETLTFENFGVRPAGMTVILPEYLSQYRPGGRFGDKKRA